MVKVEVYSVVKAALSESRYFPQRRDTINRERKVFTVQRHMV